MHLLKPLSGLRPRNPLYQSPMILRTTGFKIRQMATDRETTRAKKLISCEKRTMVEAQVYSSLKLLLVVGEQIYSSLTPELRIIMIQPRE